MLDLAATIASMEADGMDAAMIVRALKCVVLAAPSQVDAAAERRRATDRERKRLRKSAEVCGNPSSPDKEAPHTPKEINPINSAPIPPKGSPFPRQTDTEFERWYRGYPHKVQRGAAERAFVKARKIADMDALIAGVARYAAKQDDRPWQNPATWLNGKGWLDEPAQPMARDGPPGKVNPLSDAFGILDQGQRYDDQFDTAPAQGSVRYLPPAGR